MEDRYGKDWARDCLGELDLTENCPAVRLAFDYLLGAHPVDEDASSDAGRYLSAVEAFKRERVPHTHTDTRLCMPQVRACASGCAGYHPCMSSAYYGCTTDALLRHSSCTAEDDCATHPLRTLMWDRCMHARCTECSSPVAGESVQPQLRQVNAGRAQRAPRDEEHHHQVRSRVAAKAGQLERARDVGAEEPEKKENQREHAAFRPRRRPG